MKLNIILALLSLSSVAAAQQAGMRADVPQGSNEPAASSDSGPEMLSSPDGLVKDSDWYVAPVFGVTQIGGGASPTFGIRGAWRINKTLGIGLAVTGMETNDIPSSSGSADVGYGGALIEYIFKSDKLVHAVFNLTVGGGAWCSSESRVDCDSAQEFFVAQPTTNLELNVASFMRLGIGGGYRLAIASEQEGVGTSDLSGFVWQTALEFGEF